MHGLFNFQFEADIDEKSSEGHVLCLFDRLHIHDNKAAPSASGRLRKMIKTPAQQISISNSDNSHVFSPLTPLF